MKIIRLLLPAALLACACLVTGCATSTRVRISSPTKTVDIVFPKNLSAEKLDFDVDPTTGEIRMRSTKLRSDASKVIESTGALLGSVTDAATKLAPIAK